MHRKYLDRYNQSAQKSVGPCCHMMTDRVDTAYAAMCNSLSNKCQTLTEADVLCNTLPTCYCAKCVEG